MRRSLPRFAHVASTAILRRIGPWRLEKNGRARNPRACGRPGRETRGCSGPGRSSRSRARIPRRTGAAGPAAPGHAGPQYARQELGASGRRAPGTRGRNWARAEAGPAAPGRRYPRDRPRRSIHPSARCTGLAATGAPRAAGPTRRRTVPRALLRQPVAQFPRADAPEIVERHDAIAEVFGRGRPGWRSTCPDETAPPTSNNGPAGGPENRGRPSWARRRPAPAVPRPDA